MATSPNLVDAAIALRDEASKLSFADPVAYVYNPLVYAWAPHSEYLQRCGKGCKRVVFLGMNPGPWGMTQTGVPFGEIDAVKNWMEIDAPVDQPDQVHPKRPVEGFGCQKSEVSGRRLWGLFRERFGTAQSFFREHFVLNYCPLVFMEASGRNRTPDKLPSKESSQLFALCDTHLNACLEHLQAEWIVGVGGFAQSRASIALEGLSLRHGKVLHPSPASPAANRGWAEAATRQLIQQGIWND